MMSPCSQILFSSSKRCCTVRFCAAGASGLFAQPFFELRYIEVCVDVLPVTEIFWAVSPVLSAASRRYWEVKNHALFPRLASSQR